MQEDFLHYIWKYKKFDFINLKTTDNEPLEIVLSGQHNLNSGPDFFNAQIRISNQLWAGNVEIHIKSSDWFLHNHEVDSAYDNVILHVVWEHDIEIFRKDNSKIPTVELKNIASIELVNNYKRLISKSNKWINCENDLNLVDDFTINHWLERVYFERLERKSKDIEKLLDQSSKDWEAVLFRMLMKNFGLKVNGDSFLSLANSINFSMVRKLQTKLLSLEALLFGQGGLLDDDLHDDHYIKLRNEYNYLKRKFNLSNTRVIPIQFFRLRPPNFPTIRLSQLANLYYQNHHLFSKIIDMKTIDDFYELFKIETSVFWETHFTFSKKSKNLKKSTTKSFIDLLLINTIIPIKFSFAAHQGKNIDEDVIRLLRQIEPEKNNLIDKFNGINLISRSALESQALIQLKTEYCDKNKCLQCAIGNGILTRND